MATKKKHHIVSAALLALWAYIILGCTDGRKQVPQPVQFTQRQSMPSTLSPVADAKIDNKDINVYQMVAKGGSLYLTGTDFHFAKWDILSNPESPHLTFGLKRTDGQSAYDDFLSRWPEDKKLWHPDFYGSGAISILGPYAILSGAVGTSFVNVSQTTSPVEVARYPFPDSNTGSPVKDPNYTYIGIAAHPQQPIIYGFTEQDKIVVSQVNSNGLQRVGTIPYGSSPVCCVKNAATFQGKIYVAFSGMLRVYGLTSGSGLSAPQDITSYQAMNVVATDRFLYVQHKPDYAHSEGAGRQAGIYVFDGNGNSVNYFNIEPYSFAVSPDDTHLYANMDQLSVRIYRINGTYR